ncbi:hypothetical protein [Bifidobacterium asteroides]|uniref:hypothetical protein n=1 Tax=Bifidobacterium asteroides TaxID=1684 RepID=UPI003A803BF8
MKSASAIKEEEVSDAKTVLAMSRDVKTTKPASSRKTSVKTALTGDASTGELKKATENLASQISRMKAEVRTIKAKVLAVNTSKAHKLLSDAIGNADKILADSSGKVPDGDHSRDELTKTLDLAKKTLEDRKSVLKTFTDAKTTLDTKTQAVNNAVNAKAAQDAADAAAAQSQAASAAVSGGSGYSGGSSYGSGTGYSGGSGYRAPSGGSGYRAPSGGGYSAPSGGGSAPAPAPSNGGHPTWTGTTDGSNATGHWDGNHFIGEQEF